MPSYCILEDVIKHGLQWSTFISLSTPFLLSIGVLTIALLSIFPQQQTPGSLGIKGEKQVNFTAFWHIINTLGSGSTP